MRVRGRGRRVVPALAAMLAACVPCALALNPALDVSQYAHTAWRNSDGFSRGVIDAIAQTHDGYLWVGTEFGLLRFDGVRRVEWSPPDGEQLPSNYILSLLVTHDGTLWIGTEKGLASWKGGRLTRYAELAEQKITRLKEDREGSIWVGGSGVPTGRLCAIRNGAVQCYGEDGRFGGGVLSILEYHGGLWAGAATGLWRWKPDPPERYPPPRGADPSVYELTEGDNGALLLVAPGGVRRFANGRFEAYPLAVGGQFSPYRLLRDREGSLWIATGGQGLLHVHQGRTDVFTSADGLSSDNVYDVFEDREGNIWAATAEGLDRFREFSVSTISSRQGLSGTTVLAVLAAKDGSIWLGTSDGLDRWKNERLTIYRKTGPRPLKRPAQQSAVTEITDNGLPDNSLQSLFEDSRGRIWITTPRGVAWFEDGRFTPVPSVPTTFVAFIAEQGAGDIWMSGDQKSGLLHFRDGRPAEPIPWARFGRDDYGTALAADPRQGGLWLGFLRGGLAFLKDGQVRASYAARDGLGAGCVNRLRFDRDGTLWAATAGGLSRLKSGRIATLTRKNGLPCDAVQWSIEDDEGAVWLNMPCGLVRVPRSDLEAAADDANHTIQTTVFDRSDGVRSFALAYGFNPRVVKSAEGKLWFQNVYGVSVIDPGHLPFNKLPPPVQIEQVVADRRTYGAGAKLPPLVRDVEIDYTALSFVAPEKVRFRYKLEGYDPDWVDAVNRRQAFYTNLGPKSYRFRVMAANNSGVWNEAGESLDFSVDPAYYQTIWFRSLIAAAVLASLLALHLLRLRYLKHQFDIRLEARVGERTRIARELHDTLLQSFQGTLMKFHALSYVLEDRPQAQKTLRDCIEQAQAAVSEGRQAVQDMRSSTMVANDLARAITTFGRGLAADRDEQNCPEFRVQVEGKSRDLPPLVRDEAYRIACEALRNAFRHAQAKRIEVVIRYAPQQFQLCVADNGKGIEPAVLSAGGRAGHHGLQGLNERAELAGGKLAVRSKLNSGTEIELIIPAGIAYPKCSPPPTSSSTTAGDGNE